MHKGFVKKHKFAFIQCYSVGKQSFFKKYQQLLLNRLTTKMQLHTILRDLTSPSGKVSLSNLFYYTTITVIITSKTCKKMNGSNTGRYLQ